MARNIKDIFSAQWVDPIELQKKREKMEEFWSSKRGQGIKRKLFYLNKRIKHRRLLESNKKKNIIDTSLSVWDRAKIYCSSTSKDKFSQRIHFISIPMGGKPRRK